MDKLQGQLLLELFNLYDDTAKDMTFVIDAVKKRLTDGVALKQIELQVMSEHLKQQITNLQDIDKFIETRY